MAADTPRNPFPTADVIIEVGDASRIVLIKRRNEPHGWALPGGFVDYGEKFPDAAVREAKEETGLDVTLTALLGVYSDPNRDPRQHNVSAVYVGRAEGAPQGGDDAAEARLFDLSEIDESTLVFDHALILADYRRYKNSGVLPPPTR